MTGPAPAPALRPEHAAALARFHIPPELLAAAGVASGDDPAVRDLLGYHGDRGCDLSGILFPVLHPLSGAALGHRVRLDQPPAGGGKYRGTPGLRWLYFAPCPPEWLDDPAGPVIFVEAEKSALAGRALDQRSGIERIWIATGGISGWRRMDGFRDLPGGGHEAVTGPSPSLDLVRWEGRSAIIAFDSNVAARPDLRRQRRRLAEHLAGRGVAVRIAEVPVQAGVNGPDDLIAVAGDDAALGMLDAARPFADCALAEAEAAVAALPGDAKARKAADPLPAIEAVAAVDDPNRRAVLIARLKGAALTKPEIETRIRDLRAATEAERGQAAETARMGRLLGMAVDGPALLDDLAAWLRRFVVMTAAQVDVAALWAAHTHALEAADHTPYLHITAPEKRCGKSRLLEALELIAARPWRCDHTTAAALLRSVERDQPTLLLDEWDAAKGSGDEYAEAMRGLLNSGFRRGASFRLCVKGPGGEIELHDYPTFCAKAIAGIGRLPDTVADRSLTIALQRKARGEQVQPFRRREAEPDAAHLRERAEAWALQHIERLHAARPAFPDALNDRQRDVAEPLLAIADLAGGEWPQRARRALVELCTGEAAQDESVGVKLLADTKAVFEANCADRIASKDLAEALGGMEDRPWAEWGRAQKPITAPQVARQLGRHGIVPRTVRLPDGTRLKGYEHADFAEAWLRYLPPRRQGPAKPRARISRFQTVTP